MSERNENAIKQLIGTVWERLGRDPGEIGSIYPYENGRRCLNWESSGMSIEVTIGEMKKIYLRGRAVDDALASNDCHELVSIARSALAS